MLISFINIRFDLTIYISTNMNALDKRLGNLLEGRKKKNQYRQLKEYSNSSPDLIDFVSSLSPISSEMLIL